MKTIDMNYVRPKFAMLSFNIYKQFSCYLKTCALNNNASKQKYKPFLM